MSVAAASVPVPKAAPNPAPVPSPAAVASLKATTPAKAASVSSQASATPPLAVVLKRKLSSDSGAPAQKKAKQGAAAAPDEFQRTGAETLEPLSLTLEATAETLDRIAVSRMGSSATSKRSGWTRSWSPTAPTRTCPVT